MALCKNGFSAVKNIWHKITDELEVVADKVLAFTGKLRKIEADPLIASLLALIPGEAPIQAAINAAIDKLAIGAGILAETDSAQKLKDFIAEVKTFDPAVQDKTWFNLATLTIQVLDEAKDLSQAEVEAIAILKIVTGKKD